MENLAADIVNDIWIVRPYPEFRKMIPAFVENRFHELLQLEQALVQNDYTSIRRFAHQWKGICRPFGFIHLETLSINLELAAMAKDRIETIDIVARIKTFLHNVKFDID